MVKSFGITLLDRAAQHGARVAVTDASGETSFRDLLAAATRIAAGLQRGRADLGGARIAFLVSPGAAWVETLWGIWMAGGIAVPLSPLHPEPELAHVVADCGAEAVVADGAHEEAIRALAGPERRACPLRELRAAKAGALPVCDESRAALILYTSGTTGRPKGVVTTHGNLRAQIECLVEAWAWTAQDRILHVLPLHHVHGIVNVLCCALWSGATCDMLPRFDARAVWQELRSGRFSLFMAVPTIYSRLISAWTEAGPETRAAWSRAATALRLMVSGSAALPVPVLEKWREITGHTLLERYGMTEIGMALSNPLQGERRPGHVGTPMPGVEVRLVDESGQTPPDGEPGEIEVRGPAVFAEYWNRPDDTAAAFRDSWFRTGDVAVLDNGSYRILGRSSTDILKTGGYKVSALEIESALRGHPAIAECAVVGVDDPEWGQRVAAAVVLRPSATLTLAGLRAWAAERIAPYKLPTLLRCLDDLPRNAMGKVVKPELGRLLAED